MVHPLQVGLPVSVPVTVPVPVPVEGQVVPRRRQRRRRNWSSIGLLASMSLLCCNSYSPFPFPLLFLLLSSSSLSLSSSSSLSSLSVADALPIIPSGDYASSASRHHHQGDDDDDNDNSNNGIDKRNPLWREECIFTGERRGPAVTTRTTNMGATNKNMNMNMNKNERRLALKRTATTRASTKRTTARPNQPYRHQRQHQHQHQHQNQLHQQQQQHHQLLKRGGEQQQQQQQQGSAVPVHVNVQVLPEPATPADKMVERFLQFRAKRGRIKIDLGEPKYEEVDDDESSSPSPPSTSTSTSTSLTTIATMRQRVFGKQGASNSHNNSTTTSTTTTTTTTALVKVPSHNKNNKNKIKPLSKNLLASFSSSAAAAAPGNQNFEISMSVDPISVLRLMHNMGKASVGFLGAFAATLRLLAPMIVTRRVLATLGYMGYDHYNGRYLRTTYNKRLRHFHQYEIPSALRAIGRVGLQLTSMGIVGATTQFFLKRAPCWMSQRICDYWYAMVWMGAILVAARASEIWATTYYPPLQLRTTSETQKNRKSNSNNNRFASPTRVFTRPWHLLQWMKDPEEWINNLTRLNHNNHNGFSPRRHCAPFQPDALLFPSTWPPLQILSCGAMIRAIRMTRLHKEPSVLATIMQSFCLQHALHEEWNRVFLQEKRVALGAIVSVISFLAVLNLLFVAFSADGVAGVLWTPALIASLVSGWMNIVLYNERFLAAKNNNNNNNRKTASKRTTASSVKRTVAKDNHQDETSSIDLRGWRESSSSSSSNTDHIMSI